MNRKKYIQVAVPSTGESEAAAIRDVVLSGNFVSGKNVAEFEERFATYIGVQDGAAVNSGTAALHTALAVLGIGPGDEVIAPPLTFMSTVTSVLHQNATPVFADIDLENFCISPDDIRTKITDRTRAIIPVHLFGNAAEMDEIMDIADRHNLYVIEDCAQAHGTEYKGRKVGSIGHFGAFSFFATKHMTTGEGGIITSNNTEWIAEARKFRSHGMANRDNHVMLGYNYRMNEMAAAMGIVQLAKLDDFNERRRKNSLFLLQGLAKYPNKWFQVPRLAKHIKHTFFWCPLIIKSDESFSVKDVVRNLAKRGIEVRHRYQEPLYRQNVIQDLSPYPSNCPFRCVPNSPSLQYKNLLLPQVEKLAGNIIGLPNHQALCQEDLDYILETIITLY